MTRRSGAGWWKRHRRPRPSHPALVAREGNPMFHVGNRVEMNTPVGWVPGTVRAVYPTGLTLEYTVELDGVYGTHAAPAPRLRRTALPADPTVEFDHAG